MAIQWSRTGRYFVANNTARTSGFCMAHWCCWEKSCHCCDGCRERTHRVHLYFLHTEKTGGSAVECATVELARSGALIAMGHTQQQHVHYCQASCGRAPVAISVRNPYSYYESEFKYIQAGSGPSSSGSTARAYAGVARRDPRTGRMSFPISPLSSFEQWVRYVTNEAQQFTQSHRIERSCGRPCAYDFVLRTESLEKDLNHALRRAHLPARGHVAVPVFNEVRGKWQNASFKWTCDMLQLVNDAERLLFDEFGYTRRSCRNAGQLHEPRRRGDLRAY